MADDLKIANDITVGRGEPSADDFRQLAANGVRSVVDLRQEGEREQALPPSRERAEVERCGMHYLNFPVPTDRLSDDILAHFDDEVSRLPKP